MMCEEHFRGFVAVAERFAEGQASVEELVAAAEKAGDDPVDAYDAAHDPYRNAHVEAESAAEGAYHFMSTPEDVRTVLCDLLRDIAGNPFCPSIRDLHWVNSTLVRFAQAIYEERAFDRMPVLADALEDAGCTDTDILEHCRGLVRTLAVAGSWTSCSGSPEWPRQVPACRVTSMNCLSRATTPTTPR